MSASAPGVSRNTTVSTMSSGACGPGTARPRLVELMTLGRHVFGRLAAQDAGRDHGDADPARPELARERARHRDHRALARHVGEQPRRAPERGVGGDVDDAAVAARGEQRRQRAGDEPGAADVHPHHAVPEIEIDLVERLAAHIGGDRRIVDEAVNLALVLRDVARERLDRSRIVEIDRHEACLGHRGQLAGQRRGRHPPGRRRAPGGAGLGASLRDRAPDAARGTRDDDGAPGEHRPPSLRPRSAPRTCPRRRAGS